MSRTPNRKSNWQDASIWTKALPFSALPQISGNNHQNLVSQELIPGAQTRIYTN